MEGLGTLEGGVPVEVRMRGRQVLATAEAFAISQLITEALTAIVRDHRPAAVGRISPVGAGGDPRPGGLWLPRLPGARF
jgi:hypothetical protein